jgi:hypothetical protein
MKPVLTLPIRLGLTDGSNATLLVDGGGNSFGALFGIGQGASELVIRAVNNYEAMVFAMKHIASTAQHKRIANYATAALQAAKEI